VVVRILLRKYRGSFNTLMFGENKPLIGSCRDGRLDLIYCRSIAPYFVGRWWTNGGLVGFMKKLRDRSAEMPALQLFLEAYRLRSASSASTLNGPVRLDRRAVKCAVPFSP
jgi:hypothetical protein